jgi:hypothetical protein
VKIWKPSRFQSLGEEAWNGTWDDPIHPSEKTHGECLIVSLTRYWRRSRVES